MPPMLPCGNRLSIPAGYLPAAGDAYHLVMADDIKKIRRDRLNELLRTKYKATDLARALGVVDNYISRTKTGTKGIGEESAREWERKLGLPAYWFDQPTQVNLGQLPQNVDKHIVRRESAGSAVVSSVDGMSTEPAEIGNRRVPLISYEQASTWTAESASAPFAQWEVTDQPLSQVAFALTIRGDSMSPELLDGDRVIVDPSVSPTPGKLVVAQAGNDEPTLRKYRLRGVDAEGRNIFELQPLNPDYPTLSSDRQTVLIIGTVVERRIRR